MYVAVFIYGGVLEGLEVYIDEKDAEEQAEKWRTDARPEIDVVQVVKRDIHIDMVRRFPTLFRG